MAKSKKKVYVVWHGRTPGIYDSWAECAQQVEGFPNAKYKSFPNKTQARQAFDSHWQDHIGSKKKPAALPPEVIKNSLCVDAACDGSPGKLEYRGVDTASRAEIFHVGPLPSGTNNLGEFLAIVHALAHLQKQGLDNIPIYSDSRNALGWVKDKACRSKLARTSQTEPVWALADRALTWLNNNTYHNPLLKWKTKEWGEIPADFGRK